MTAHSATRAAATAHYKWWVVAMLWLIPQGDSMRMQAELHV